VPWTRHMRQTRAPASMAHRDFLRRQDAHAGREWERYGRAVAEAPRVMMAIYGALACFGRLEDGRRRLMMLQWLSMIGGGLTRSTGFGQSEVRWWGCLGEGRVWGFTHLADPLSDLTSSPSGFAKCGTGDLFWL
jgi:hypothetical protein